MIGSLLAAAALAAAAPAVATADINHAIAMGRFDQARLMIAKALGAGAAGDPIDRTLADLAFASRRDAEALARLERLVIAHPKDASLLERAAIAAIRTGNRARANELLDRALVLPGASWRAWNAKAALDDDEGDWDGADAAYARAAELAPDRAEIANNRGWSHLLRGEWPEAASQLQAAAALDPGSARIANNLEFARMGLAEGLPQRAPGETVGQWAARLNDAGVAARMRGEPARAKAAFTRAIEASGSWYERAYANLQQVEAKP